MENSYSIDLAQVELHRPCYFPFSLYVKVSMGVVLLFMWTIYLIVSSSNSPALDFMLAGMPLITMQGQSTNPWGILDRTYISPEYRLANSFLLDRKFRIQVCVQPSMLKCNNHLTKQFTTLQIQLHYIGTTNG